MTIKNTKSQCIMAIATILLGFSIEIALFICVLMIKADSALSWAVVLLFLHMICPRVHVDSLVGVDNDEKNESEDD